MSVACIEKHTLPKVKSPTNKSTFAQFKQMLLNQGSIEESANSISFTDNELAQAMIFRGKDRHEKLYLYLHEIYEQGSQANQTAEPSTLEKIMMGITGVTAFMGAVIVPAMSAMERLHVFEHMSNAWNHVQDHLPGSAALLTSSICVMHGQSKELCAVWPMLACMGKALGEITVINPVPDQLAYPNQAFSLNLNAKSIFNQTTSTVPLSLSINQKSGASLPSWLNFSIQPELIGSFKTPSAVRAFITDNKAYIADYANGLMIVDVTNGLRPSLLGQFSIANAVGIYVVGNKAYLTTTSSLNIIDIANSHSPSLLGSLAITNAISVCATDNTAYVTTSAGINILNVSNSTSPSLLGSLATPYEAHDLYVVGGQAYIADLVGGLKVISVTNGSSPSLLGSFFTVSAYGVYTVGNIAYVADSRGGLKIIDVSTASKPTLLGTLPTTQARGVHVVGKKAYVADWTAGLQIIDVSNSQQPSLLGSVPTNTAYGVQAFQDKIYVADGSSGLKIAGIYKWLLAGTPPSVEHAKCYNVTLKAQNDLGDSASTSFLLSVYNEGPHLVAPILEQGVHIGKPLDFTVPGGTFSDPYGDALTYMARLFGGDALPDWLHFDGNTRKFSGTPTAFSDIRQLDVEVTATDPYGKSAFNDFMLNVLHTGPFVAQPISNQTLAIRNHFDFTVPKTTFGDLDGVTLTYDLAGGNLPEWLSFDNSELRFTGTPSRKEDLGTLVLNVAANDPFAKSTIANVYLYIYNKGISVTKTIADKTITANFYFEYPIAPSLFVDNDGMPLTKDVSLIDGNPLPTWLNFDFDNSTFFGTPNAQDLGVAQIRLYAHDSYGAEAKTDFEIIVNANDYKPPIIAKGITDQEADVGKLFKLTIPEDAFRDPQNTALIYNAYLKGGKALPTWLSFAPETNTFRGSPKSSGTLEVVVVARDVYGLSGQTVFTINVTNQKVKEAKEAFSIAGPIASVASILFAGYKYRHWLWNKYMKRKYIKADQTIVLGGNLFSYSITSIKRESIKEVRVIQDGKDLPGGLLRPDWLEYDECANLISVDISQLSSKHVGKWTIRVIGKDCRIREQFNLNVENAAGYAAPAQLSVN